MIVTYKCFECGFEGEVLSDNRKIICPRCGIVNDFWLDDELPPENHRVHSKSNLYT
jgi:phage FluMu protein Com